MHLRQTLLYMLLLLLAGGSVAWADKPQRIVSMNLCTDQLVLLLADPDKIISVSYLSLEEHSSFVASEVRAAGYFVNHNLPEEILPLNPDLIVTGEIMQQQEARLLQHLGKRVETFPIFNSLADVTIAIRKMAGLLGEQARGERLIAEMEQRLASLLARASTEKLSAVVWQPRGYTEGAGTLMDELMTLAGWHNVARDFGISGYGQIGLEDLLLSRPRKMIVSEYSPGTRSLGQAWLQHPVLERLFAGSQPLILDTRLLICGGPMNLLALEALIEARNAR